MRKNKRRAKRETRERNRVAAENERLRQCTSVLSKRFGPGKYVSDVHEHTQQTGVFWESDAGQRTPLFFVSTIDSREFTMYRNYGEQIRANIQSYVQSLLDQDRQAAAVSRLNVEV